MYRTLFLTIKYFTVFKFTPLKGATRILPAGRGSTVNPPTQSKMKLEDDLNEMELGLVERRARVLRTYKRSSLLQNPSLSRGVTHQDPNPCSSGTHIYISPLLVYLINLISAGKSKRREDLHSISKSSLSLHKHPKSNCVKSNLPLSSSSAKTTTAVRRTAVINQVNFTQLLPNR